MIDLYFTPTSNGFKASIPLEEMCLDYTLKPVNLKAGEHLEPAYKSITPTCRIPAIVDRDGYKGATTVVGTQAIAVYLDQKTGGHFSPQDAEAHTRMTEVLGVVTGDLGPVFAVTFVHDFIASEKSASLRDYYRQQGLRMFAALDTWLEGLTYFAGEQYSLADMMVYPHIAISLGQMLDESLTSYPNLEAWAGRVSARPAIQRAMKLGPVD